ncbi:hypothetical protein MPK67_gp038 [Erwinia phage pEa_SNUABM_32]|uniref:Uncharacterized protein n=2 Tax=Alexandravirus TaxID=2733088 RepID=A0AAE7XIS1_9CAUD|nr:hypothetical protein MPK67_gp038 [Erwinia phage pEa_SNUABM_32]YP_010301151.1 hypothetical protein MPK68_gp038 [Erwinia phage pEa_SNUABM_3]UAW52820.1 hypothetical protein pEaSNUABM23_00038 [Erwinia phage pEa_SNUABM_23]UIW10716.1 hypothetical protein pEaSNUABM23_00038 [Erwinia phage pEa_SNUABM_31]QZE56235.1 hypothetical protein pEaSNUABM3_00038 [Erwinia phage pEa_SNUABM_3]QZE56911.1 hypothetical protein pEaSNUABM32_00038 [Erwinia phage pEa_SNUABM_32]
MSDFNKFKDGFLRSVGIDPKRLDLPEDPEGAEIFNSLNAQDQRKVKVGLALLHLQVPDEVRYELLTNHLDETERLVSTAFEDLTASLVNKLSQAGDAETKSTLGSVRLAMLMNILGFDDATLTGVLNDPILTRRASLVAVTCMNEMGQKIQQMYDEKSNEPT